MSEVGQEFVAWVQLEEKYVFRSIGFPHVQPIAMHCSQAMHLDLLNIGRAGGLHLSDEAKNPPC